MVRSVAWFALAVVAALVAITSGWSAFYVAWLSDACVDWVPYGCGQTQTMVFLAAGYGSVGAWSQGVPSGGHEVGAGHDELVEFGYR